MALGLLSELKALVQKVETAQLESRPLCKEEALALEALPSAWEASEPQSQELRSCAERIWAALGHGTGLEALQAAKCRRLACELYGKSPRQSHGDASHLACHWVLAGRAWTAAEQPLQALPCFLEAMKPWNAQPSDLTFANVAAQALLYAAEAHFLGATYQEAFSHLARAREMMRGQHELQGVPAPQGLALELI